MLYRFSVINRLLALLQGDESFLPRRLASFVASAPRRLAHVIDRVHVIDFDLKYLFDRRLDLGLGCVPVNAERQQLAAVLRLFFSDQSLFRNHRRLDDVPRRSHLLGRLLLWFSFWLWLRFDFLNRGHFLSGRLFLFHRLTLVCFRTEEFLDLFSG